MTAPKIEYLYRVLETGELVKVELTFEEILEKERDGFLELPDGRVGRRAVGEEIDRDNLKEDRSEKRVTRAKWPMVSVNAGVNPEQADELRSHWKKHGITGCEVLPNGNIKYDDPMSRRRDMRSRQLHDREGFD